MPSVSKRQFRFMAAIEHGGIPGRGSLTPAKAAEFVDATPSYKALPESSSGSGLGRAAKSARKKRPY
jgi:hypothetical protein